MAANGLKSLLFLISLRLKNLTTKIFIKAEKFFLLFCAASTTLPARGTDTKIQACRVAKLIKAGIMAIQIVDTANVPLREPKSKTIEKLYSFRRASEVTEFLKVHPFLVPLLMEAYGKIGDYFGPKPEIVLEVVADPEVRELIKMFAYIVTTLSSDEAGRRLQQYDRGWFLQQTSRAKGLLNFDVEFR